MGEFHTEGEVQRVSDFVQLAALRDLDPDGTEFYDDILDTLKGQDSPGESGDFLGDREPRSPIAPLDTLSAAVDLVPVPEFAE